MPFGLYISVPFCKSKCSYCNFASGVFPRAQMQAYMDRICRDLDEAEELARVAGGQFERAVDSIYLGGGTPSLLSAGQLKQIFQAVQKNFDVQKDAEVTVECAPGTLGDEVLGTLLETGANRISLGVQSFVDEEARAVGRLHTRADALADIRRLHAAGIENINLDLIAGLPHQTRASWQISLDEVIASEVPHASVYMLEVDEDSRLGRELLAGGSRYHAHFVPDEELTVELYAEACERLNSASVQQYEISNFSRAGKESRHNLKYWTRQPYLGFGVDAHSMLRSSSQQHDAIRFAMPESLEEFSQRQHLGEGVRGTPVSEREAWEETFFLGLRLNAGVDLTSVEKRFGAPMAQEALAIAKELQGDGLASLDHEKLQLTDKGRLLSNEVFARFIGELAHARK